MTDTATLQQLTRDYIQSCFRLLDTDQSDEVSIRVRQEVDLAIAREVIRRQAEARRAALAGDL